MLDETILKTINPESLTSYLARNGWVNKSPNKDAYKYVHDEGGILILPTSSNAPRYEKSVRNVISIISEWENRSFIDVYQSIVSPYSDSLVISFAGQIAKQGSLPLSYIHDAIGNIKNTVLYSACAEIQPKAYYKRPLKRAKEITEKARFGQTQIGSFILSISLPHSPTTQNMKEPIERSVFKRIMTGIKQARDCVTNGKSIDTNNGYIRGLNSNIAESIFLLNREGLNLKISGLWDEHIAISDEYKEPLEIEERTFEMLDSISNDYRGEEISQPISITKAKVTSLKWDPENPDSDDEMIDCLVTLKILEPENIPASNVQVELEREEYLKACEAHINSREVRIHGQLNKYKNRWWLFKHSKFEIIE